MAETIVDLGKKVKAKYPGQYDALTDADVGAKVKAKYPESYGHFADVEKGWLDHVGDYFQDTWKEVNPINMIKGAVEGTAQLAYHPVDTAKAYLQSNEDIARKAEESFKKGDYATGTRHVLGYLMNMVPGLGAKADIAGDEMQKGNYGKGLGMATGTALAFAMPEVIPRVIPKGIPIAPKVGSNPLAVAAVKTSLDEGVPMNLAAATDNRFITGMQEMSASTPTGAYVAGRGQHAERAGIANWAERSRQEAAPPTTVRAAYGDWDAANANPANVRPIQVGTKQVQVPAQGNQMMPGYKPAGTQTVPIIEDMALPVDISGLKPAARAFIKERQGWSLAKKQSDSAYALAEMIANGPDHVPGKTAEAALSDLKNTRRQIGSDFTNDTEQTLMRGQTGSFVSKLQDAIDRDVAALDPAAAASLKTGRKSAARQAGSDWLGDVFEKATSQGEWNRHRWIWNQWDNLDAAEKAVMFPNPTMRQNLDALFLAQKRAGDVSVGSRTAPMHAAGQMLVGGGSYASGHPVISAISMLAPPVIQALFYNPTFVRAAINGLKLPVRSPAAALAAANLLKMAGQPVPAQAPAAEPAAQPQ